MLITILAIDHNSSETTSRTFNVNDKLKVNIQAWEAELKYSKYEFECQEIMDEYPDSVKETLDELEVTF
jgi:hypothetical protein